MIDRLIAPLRTAARDLVAKRLWPIAVVLVVALVAVPVVIGSSASDAPAPVAAAPAATAPAAGTSPESAITVVAPAIVGRSRPGAVHDPFYDPPKPKDTTTSTASPSTSASSPAPAPAPSSAARPAPANSAAPKSSPEPGASAPAGATDAASVYRTRLRWGPDDEAAVRGVSRLEPLGGTSNPALLYLGTTEGGARAVFLLGPNASSDVAKRGCAEKTCRIVALKAGQSTAVAVQGVDGGEVRNFTLVIDAIAERAVAGEAAAAEQRTRVHHDGRDVLRAMIKDAKTAAAIGQFAYDRTLGAVVAIDAR